MLRGVYVGHHERPGAPVFLTPDGLKRRTRIARMFGARVMGSRVQCNVCWSSLVVQAGSAESGETCCACGRSRTRCCVCDRDACRSEH